MSKPYSHADLSDQLDRDLTWRLREFSDLKAAIRAADRAGRRTLLRALIALIYAHWEGYVKACASKYFQHIALRRFSYDELQRQFYLNAFLMKMDNFYKSKASISSKCHFLDQVLDSRGERFSQINNALVDTKSNLSIEVLRDICQVCAIPVEDFVAHETFLNVIVLKRRNEIAHGEEVYLEEDEIDDIIDRIIGLMRTFRNLLENKVTQRAYLIASV